MAEFCWDCARDKLGIEPARNDFHGLVEPGHTAQVLCEGCGPITVNHAGQRTDTEAPRDQPISEATERAREAYREIRKKEPS